MDYAEALAYLDAHTNLGVKPGLDRMNWLMDAMGEPQRSAAAVHVTGTNGKTTTARLIARILQAHGVRTGTYTSPHLERVNERIAIDCDPVSDEAFAAAFDDVHPFLELMREQTGDVATYFEIVTAMAFAAFADAPVGLQVLEVGLGGRWDASNVVAGEVAVVTNVSVDHTEYLGETRAEIAAEKAGIIKKDAIAVLGWADEEAAAVLRRVADDTEGCEAVWAGQDFDLEGRCEAHGGQVIDVKGVMGTYRDIYLPLYGAHQAANAAVAIAASESVAGAELDEETVKSALASAVSPGRIEVMARNPLVIIDCAHNEDGVRALLDALRESFFYERMFLVFGVSSDKDYAAMLRRLASSVHQVVTCMYSGPRALPSDELGVAATRAGCGEVRVCQGVDEAVGKALDAAGPDDLVLVAGSIYLAGEARRHLAGETRR